MGEQSSGGEPVRDATGLVVGSPEWLSEQRKIERKQTPHGLRREGTWQVVLGAVIVAISLFITLTMLTGDGALGLELTPKGVVTICVIPPIVGGYVVIHGLRQRAEHKGAVKPPQP